MKKDSKRFVSISLRYIILLLLAFDGLAVFYVLFTPLTTGAVHFLLNLFFDTSMSGNTIDLVKNITIEIIPACVAGSAYYLLLILNFSLGNLKPSKRLGMILFSFALLFIVNVLRISLLSLMLGYDVSGFELTHKIFWYAGSTLFVVGIWFLETKLFGIDQIPFQNDLKFVYSKTKSR